MARFGFVSAMAGLGLMGVVILGEARVWAAQGACFSTQDQKAMAAGFPAQVCLTSMSLTGRSYRARVDFEGSPFKGSAPATVMELMNSNDALVFVDLSYDRREDSICGEAVLKRLQFQAPVVNGAIVLENAKLTASIESMTDSCHHLGRELIETDYTRSK